MAAKKKARARAAPAKRTPQASASWRFRGAVEVGHGDTYVVIAPGHPNDVWPDAKPVAIPRPDDPRGGKGWLVSGTANGVAFDGHIGHRYGRTYVILPPGLRAAAAIAAGDDVDVVVRLAGG